MNLTGRSTYQKQAKKQGKRNQPTPAQRLRWERIRLLGCSVTHCNLLASIHHTHTGMGGRKDHDKVIGLCHFHHQGDEGIHKGRAAWQEKYGTEDELLERLARLLGEINPSEPTGSTPGTLASLPISNMTVKR